MVGDSVEDDVEGALALGMRAFLVDREGRYAESHNPVAVEALPDLWTLPAALGLQT
jgi:FMN phosphatase YigB (HAD superfamily)